MKRFFVCFAVLAAMAFMVGCGGSSNSSGENSGNSICHYGEYECHGDDSYFCGYSGDDLMWLLSEECSYGCEYGKCIDSSDSGSDSSASDDNSSECTSGKFKCVGDESHYCNSTGSWVYDSRCENGCDSSTGKCKTNSGDNEEPSTDLTCVDEGSYRCYDDKLRQQCNSGTWKTVEECEYECNTTTSKCEDDKGCKSGEYKCTSAKLSSYCENNFWKVNEECEYACDYSTGKCKDSECTTGEYLCGDSKDEGFSYASYYCSQGYWTYDHTCPGKCDSSTGKCDCAKVNGKTWSEAVKNKTWEEAKTYCENLVECGYSDWHLPTISELRTLIQNCPATMTGGECGVADSCLSFSECWNSTCQGCDFDSSGKYSKLGDTYWLWSSSVRSDGSGYAWYVVFDYGRVGNYYKSNTYSVRCVR